VLNAEKYIEFRVQEPMCTYCDLPGKHIAWDRQYAKTAVLVAACGKPNVVRHITS